MTFVQFNPHPSLTFWEKIKYFDFILITLTAILAAIGFIILYSVGQGDPKPWVIPQLLKCLFGLLLLFGIAFTPLSFWQRVAYPLYFFSIGLLILVELIGLQAMGAKRWIDIGFFTLQPSELVKLTCIIALANYYCRIDLREISNPLQLIVPMGILLAPVLLVLTQPDLGTSFLILIGGGIVLFVAGVSIYYFIGLLIVLVSGVAIVLISRGTAWQLLKDYQYKRIDIYLNPDLDPLGAGYHITQSLIAIGSGGIDGKGLLNGTQSQLKFLPEIHTDFAFTVLAEELGLVWSLIVLILFFALVVVLLYYAYVNLNRFGCLMLSGIAGLLFLYFSTNIGMVTGLLPVVGVPLPLISYGGSSLLTIMIALGIAQSAIIHDPKRLET